MPNMTFCWFFETKIKHTYILHINWEVSLVVYKHKIPKANNFPFWVCKPFPPIILLYGQPVKCEKHNITHILINHTKKDLSKEYLWKLNKNNTTLLLIQDDCHCYVGEKYIIRSMMIKSYTSLFIIFHARLQLELSQKITKNA